MERQSGNRNGSLLRPETRSVASSSSDFVLQWGNRKRLRCMKNDPSGSGQGQRRRVERRAVRSGRNIKEEPELVNGSSEAGKSNGQLDIHQNPASSNHRILRNSESSIGMMRSNGVDKKGGVTVTNNNTSVHLNNNTSNKNNNSSNHHNDDNNNNHQVGSGSGGGGASGSSSAGDAIAATWPPKFVIALTNKEKEEDFMLLKGSKLPQRPKKRAKFIQRTLNLVSPGTWLSDLTLDRYEVREKKVTKKRPRGLKAMGNCMDSDSE